MPNDEIATFGDAMQEFVEIELDRCKVHHMPKHVALIFNEMLRRQVLKLADTEETHRLHNATWEIGDEASSTALCEHMRKIAETAVHNTLALFRSQ